MVGKIFLVCGLLCLAVVCWGDGNPYTICPEAHAIEPCTCVKECKACIAYITCSNITNVQTLYDVMKKSEDFPFRAAVFQDSVFEYIPAQLFEQKAYRRLVVKDCFFSSLLNRPLEKKTPLYDLMIDNAKVQTGATFEFFLTFEALKVLDIRNMRIKKISKKMMQNLPVVLEDLHFERTNTERIDSDAFAHLTNLIGLDVIHGGLKKIEASMFPPSIAILNFSHNKLKYIPPNFAKDFRLLSHLDLMYNEITTVDESAFGTVGRSLIHVDLRENPLLCKCDMKWLLYQKRPAFDGRCDGKETLVKDLTETDFSYC